VVLRRDVEGVTSTPYLKMSRSLRGSSALKRRAEYEAKLSCYL